MKLDYKKTFLLGFGFFGISVIWSVYNSYVPISLCMLQVKRGGAHSAPQPA